MSRTTILPLALAAFSLFGAQEVVKKDAGKPPACVVDIDSTITDYRYSHKKIDEKVHLEPAAAVLRGLDGEGVAIVYLSKRRQRHLPQTVWWLQRCGFPPGKVIHRTDETEGGTEFKVKQIARIRKRCNVLFGIGDKDDLKPYCRAGIFPITFDQWEDRDWEEARKIIRDEFGLRM